MRFIYKQIIIFWSFIKKTNKMSCRMKKVIIISNNYIIKS